jgi:hypothetical protein
MSFFSIGIHPNKSRNNREVVENFSGLVLAITVLLIALLMTVWALFTAAMWPNKTTARVYTAVISLRLET